MKTVKAASVIDSVFVGEVTIDALKPEVQVTAKYGLANSESGDRFGSGHRSLWSPQTLELMMALLDSMEEDLAEVLFPGSKTTTGGAEVTETTTSGGVPSL